MLLSARQTAFLLIQDRSRPLRDRLALLLCLAKRLQDNLDDLPLCQTLCRQFEQTAYQDRQLRRIRRKRRHGTLVRVRQLLGSMDHLTQQFPHVLKDLEHTDPEQYPALEHLAVYFLFRWWLKAACDDCIWQQAAACAVSVMTVAAMAKTMGSLPQAVCLFSKEIEHSEENVRLFKQAMDLPCFSLPELLKLTEVLHAV